MPPSYQGEFDGLCGPYAIANALEECCYTDKETIFKLACEALSKRRWPAVLWSGTTFRDMQRMIRACLQNINHIQVRYPFMHSIPESNDIYWEKFDTIFNDQSAMCGIIGVTKPAVHWIVVSRNGNRIDFKDSRAGEPYLRKNRSSLIAGLRRKKTSQWLINRKELIVFSSYDVDILDQSQLH
jgi:hypothetical protein